MIRNLDNLLLQDSNLEIKYSVMFDIILKFIKVEYKIDYNKDTSNIISEMEDLDIPPIIFRIMSDILERIQISKENKTELTDTAFVKDVNNLKFVILNSIEKTGIL